MNLCYIDESGTPDIPGNTSHYVLAALSIPVWHWKDCDRGITLLKSKYSLIEVEIHIAWILRKYFEQSKIKDFVVLNHDQRRYEVEKIRKTELLRLQKSGKSKQYHQTKKNYRKTADYIHLSFEERIAFTRELAQLVANWGFARLFAECVDKIHFDSRRTQMSVDEQAFEQVVSRYEQFLEITKSEDAPRNFGLLIHDNNPTVAKRHTELMKKFHRRGTLWTKVRNIIETPLYVDSALTSMVQIADICAYSLRRYLENNEEELFNLVFERADRKGDIVVGVRHFSELSCECRICAAH